MRGGVGNPSGRDGASLQRPGGALLGIMMVESLWWTIGGGGALLVIFSPPADAWGQEEFGGDWGWGWRHGDAGQAIIIELVLLLPFLLLGIFFYFKAASSSTKDWDKNRISKFSCRRSSAGGRRDV